MTRLGKRLEKLSPFFGAKPSALALLQYNFHAGQDWRSLPREIDFIEETIQGHNTRLKWWLGLGPRFFKRYPNCPKPRSLSPLQLNHDEDCGIGAGHGETDVLIAIAGKWEAVIESSKRISKCLHQNFLVLQDFHFGHHEETERDHSGFIDGTSNLQELTRQQFARCVAVQAEEDPRFAGGSYLVFRKYQENLELWNDLPDTVHEQMIGRRKIDGAFLDGEFDWSHDAWRVTLPQAHIRAVHPRDLPAEELKWWQDRIYRRSIKFTESDGNGALKYGLLFLALNRDPHRQFERIHNTRVLPLNGHQDLLMSAGYIKPLATACYFLPGDIYELPRILSSNGAELNDA